MASDVKIRRVTLWLCDLCLGGAGGECHTPGCALWLNRAPDLPLYSYLQEDERGPVPGFKPYICLHCKRSMSRAEARHHRCGPSPSSTPEGR